MAYNISNLREHLAGYWTLNRTVADKRRKVSGELRGKASFVQARDGLYLSEEGWFQFGDFSGRTYRNYRYVFHVDTCAEVRFVDGTHFYYLSLLTGSCETEYLCGNDTYLGSFRAASSRRLDTEWRICGPTKDCVISSRYCKHPTNVIQLELPG